MIGPTLRISTLQHSENLHMSLPPPGGPRRYRGLVGRCSMIVPAIVFGAWRVAGAQDGPHGGDMTPFLLTMAAILVAAKLGGELVERHAA